MHLPAAELLLKQFLKASDDIIAKIPPQENFVALLAEARFSRALGSLRLLVQHHMGLLVRQLEAWRAAAHAAFARLPEKTERERMITFSKRVAMEGIYFEAALQLLDEYTDDFLGCRDFVEFYDNLQQSAFRLLMVASEDSFPPDVASLYRVVVAVAARVLGAISRKVALSHVVDPFIRLLTDRINPKKDASGNKPNYDALRAQIVRLTNGMRFVSLSFESEEAVREAVDFLRRAHPLAHTAPVKKSQIHHALSDMLSAILLPLVRSDAPQRAAAQLGVAALEPWYATVMAMRNDVTNWMNKHQKHVNDGYLLSTTLLCLASDKDYSAHIDVTADFLHKGLKVKENRTVCVRCCVVLACSYLVRYGAHIIKHELHKWLDRVLRPVTALARKGGLTVAEQMDVIAPIAELSPEFAVQHLVLELLTCDTPDCVLAGLRALQGLILMAPAVAAAAAAASGTNTGGGGRGTGQHCNAPFAVYGGVGAAGNTISSTASTSSSSSGLQALLRRTTAASLGGVLYGSSAAAAAASSGGTSSGGAGSGDGGGGGGLLGGSAASGGAAGAGGAAGFAAVDDMLRRGVHPLEMLGVGHLVPRLGAALAKLLSVWHATYGGYVLYGPADPNWKEKAPGLPLLVTLVRLLPYLKPETWPSNVNVKPLEWLPIYTAHVEAPLRSAAVEALGSLMRGCPHLRNTLVTAVAACTVSLPDDAVQPLREAQSLLRSLMELWGSLLAERASGAVAEQSIGPGSGGESLRLDVHRLEGCALVCLASHDEAARREALQTLSLIRSLHQAILSAEPYGPPSAPPFLRPSPAAGLSGALGAAGPGGLGSGVRNLSSGGLTAFGSGSVGSGTPAAAHGRSVSRDSADLQTVPGLDGSAAGAAGLTPARGNVATPRGGGSGADPGLPLTYVIEVVEESGPSLVRATYWDFGDWSDMWRQYKEVPPDVTFEEVLVAPSRPGDDVPRVRLARSLVELMCLVVRLCPASAGVAGVELMGRLVRCLGRVDSRVMVLPEYLETPKRDAWRNLSAMVCACPQALRERALEKLGRRPSPLTPRELIRLHLALATHSAAPTGSPMGPVPSSIQLCSMFSLGHVSPDFYGLLLDELSPYMEDYAASSRGAGGGSSSRSRTKRPEELRRTVSHVFRILTECASPEALSSPPLRTRLLEFIRETYAFLRPSSLSTDAFWEVPQVAYCFASVVRNCAVPLRALLSQPVQGGPGGSGPGGAQLGRDSQGRGEAAAAAGAAGAQGGAGGASPSLRKLLWEMAQVWCEEAYILLNSIKAHVASLPSGSDPVSYIRQCKDSNYLRAVNIGISSALAKYKEPTEAQREELVTASHYINHSARLALAALLEGPMFDADNRRPAGPVFTWIDKLLAVREDGKQRVVSGPRRQDVGHRALRGVLTHNPDLFESCLDKCYDSNDSIASSYFQVLCEVYATQPVRCPPHVVLALVLVKLVDPVLEVREDAMHMLNVLHQREWRQPGVGAAAQGAGTAEGGQQTGPPGSGAGGQAEAVEADGKGGNPADAAAGPVGPDEEEAVVVLGGLQDTYQEFQYTLACRLAREHPELSEPLCQELMTRQLECEAALIQHPVLTSLAPWMENLSVTFPWRGNWSEQLLRSMYLVTQRHGSQFPGEVGRLWTRLAARTRNINPVLDFLLHIGVATALQTDLGAMLQYFGVAKRIVLYLARVSPAETLGYLAIELARQQMESEPLGAGGGGAGGGEGGEEGGGGGLRGGRSHASQQQHSQQHAAAAQQQVLVFGGPLDCLVMGEEKTMHMSYESGASLSSASAGVAAGSSAGAGANDASVSSSANHHHNHPYGNNAGANRHNRSLDQGPRALSEASGSSRSDANGLGAVSVADSATTHPRGGGPDHYKLRPAEDSALGHGPGSGPGGGGGGDTRRSPSVSRTHLLGPGGPMAGNRALLTRPEIVLCCLSEVVYEHPVDPQHLPLLLHVALTCADHEEPVVAGHCRQLLINLLYSLSVAKAQEEAAAAAAAAAAAGPGTVAGGAPAVNPAPHPSHQPSSAAHVLALASSSSHLASTTPPSAELILHLQSLRTLRLWPCEDYCLTGTAAVLAAAAPEGHLLPSSSALGALAVALTRALEDAEPELAPEWAARALEWAQHARSRHAACRSWQVLRALQPPLKADLAAALVLGLEACFQAGSAAGCEVAVEIITTTRMLVQALTPGRLVLYPQLWWTALALLHSPHVAIYRAALGLLAACLGVPGGASSGASALGGSSGGVGSAGGAAQTSSQLRLASAKVQAVLLAAAPGLAAGQLLAASHAAAMQDAAEDADPWVLGHHLLNVREGPPPSPHASMAVQQLLLRGLMHPLTVIPTLHLLAALGEALALALQGNMLSLPRVGPIPTAGTTTGPSVGATSSSSVSPHGVTVAAGGAGEGGAATVAGSGPAGHRPGALGVPGSGFGTGSSGGGGASGGHQPAPLPAARRLEATQQAPPLEVPEVADEPGYGGPGSPGAIGSAGAGGGGGGATATVAPHSDSLRKHRALKLDSFQTLLGSCRSQFFVSLMGLLPLMLSLHGGGAASSSGDAESAAPIPVGGRVSGGYGRGSVGVADGSRAGAGSAGVSSVAGLGSACAGGGGGGGSGAVDPEELQEGIAAAVRALGRAASCLGLGEVGAQLQALSSQQACHDPELLDSLTTQLLTQISRSLFPRYARWFLHHTADLLLAATGTATPASAAAVAVSGSAAAAASGGAQWAGQGNAAAVSAGAMPAGPRQAHAALVLLKCLFRVEDLRLGPGAAALVADGTLLQPVVALTAGPLGGLALETLAEAMRFSQEERFQRDLSQAASRAGVGAAEELLGPRTLFPPATPVAMALKKVVDTLGSGLRRRNKNMRLMPFLGAGVCSE